MREWAAKMEVRVSEGQVAGSAIGGESEEGGWELSEEGLYISWEFRKFESPIPTKIVSHWSSFRPIPLRCSIFFCKLFVRGTC